MESNLDLTQLRAIVAFRKGLAVALLGGGGSGKSYMLSILLEQARRKFGRRAVLACALTNQASSNIGGLTIHSVLGVRPCFGFDKEKLWDHVRKKVYLCDLLREVKVVVIDEVSLLKEKVLDGLDWVMRHTAESTRLACCPMGGRQLIVAGDPFQLEPIEVNHEKEGERQVFSARTWQLTFGGFGSGVVAILKGNHRQWNDDEFYKILTRVRQGKTSDEDIRVLNKTGISSDAPPPTHTVLCLLKKEVEAVNKTRLSLISGPKYMSMALDKFCGNRTIDLQRRLSQAAPHVLTVKRGCELIITRKQNSVIPGTRGTVLSVRKCHEHAQLLVLDVQCEGRDELVCIKPMKFEVCNCESSVLGWRLQLPVVSAYAMTVHRSQGLTLGRVAMDFRNVSTWIPSGMAYVALSRCTSTQGLWVRGLEKKHIVVNIYARRLMEEIRTLKHYFIHRVISSSPFPNLHEPEHARKRSRETEDSVNARSAKSKKVIM